MSWDVKLEKLKPASEPVLPNHGFINDKELRKILDHEGILKSIVAGDVAKLNIIEKSLDDSGRLNDKDMDRLTAQLMKDEHHDTVKLGDADSLLIGTGNGGRWSGDISNLVK